MSSMPWMLGLLSALTWAEGQFILQATVKKSLRVILEDVDMPATWFFY